MKKPIDPVALPAALRRDWPAPRPVAEVAEQGAQYRERVMAVHYERGKELRTTERWQVEVLDEAGVARFRNLDFGFDPMGEEVFLNSLTVRDAKGEIVATAKPEDCFVTDDAGQLSRGVITSHKVMQVAVPGLRPGRVLEVVFTRRDLAPPREFRWFKETFSRLTPTARSMVYVEGDVDDIRAEHTKEVRTSEGAGFRAWFVDQPVLWRAEPMQPADDLLYPTVWLSDARANWADLASSYLAVLRGKRVIDDDVRAAFAEADLSGKDEDKVLRLARLVQHRCAYQSVELGTRSRIPATPGETLRNRFGDCKDQSVLLCELLRLGGIDAHLALANLHTSLRTNLPSLDQFSHMLVYVPDSAGARFLDTTARDVDPSISPAVSLGGSQVFMLDPVAPRFVTVPVSAAGSASVKLARELSVTNRTDLIVRETLEAVGSASLWFRLHLTAATEGERRSRLQRLLATVAPTLELTALAVDGLDDVTAPVRVRLSAKIPRGLAAVGDRLVGALPAAWEQLWFSPSPAMARHTPFEVRQPWLVESSVSFTSPTGYEWTDAPKLAGKADNDFVNASLAVQESGPETEFTTRAERITGLFPAARAADERRAMLDVSRLLTPALILERILPK